MRLKNEERESEGAKEGGTGGVEHGNLEAGWELQGRFYLMGVGLRVRGYTGLAAERIAARTMPERQRGNRGMDQ